MTQHPSPFNTAALQLKGVSLEQYVKMLSERICRGYMPSSTSSRQYATKPHYGPARAIINANYGTGYYCREKDLFAAPLKTSDLNELPMALFRQEKDIFFALCACENTELLKGDWVEDSELAFEDLTILTRLENPLDDTYVQFKKDGQWGSWMQWKNDNSTLALNPYTLQTYLDIYC